MKGRKREAPQGRNTQREGDPPRVGNWGQEEQRALCRVGLSRVQGVLQPCSLLRYMLPTSLTLSPSTLLSLHPRQMTLQRGRPRHPLREQDLGEGRGIPSLPYECGSKTSGGLGSTGQQLPTTDPTLTGPTCAGTSGSAARCAPCRSAQHSSGSQPPAGSAQTWGGGRGRRGGWGWLPGPKSCRPQQQQQWGGLACPGSWVHAG